MIMEDAIEVYESEIKRIKLSKEGYLRDQNK